MQPSEAMTWFLITVGAFFSLMVLGIYFAVHTYDKHRNDPYHHHHA